MHSSERYMQLFTDTASGAIATNHTAVGRYRCKTIKAGKMLECEIFPIWNTANEVRKAKHHITRAEQIALNERNARKRLERS